MKMLRYFLFFVVLFFSQITFAQTTTEEDEGPYRGYQVYGEIGGPGVVFSANFDSRFKQGTDLGWGYRVGLGFGVGDESYGYYSYDYEYYYYDTKTISYLTIPLGINYVFGKKRSPHTFEVGLGTTILSKSISLYNYDDHYQTGNFIGHASFMYRKKPIDGGFTWRIGFTPIVGTAGDISPAIAVGLGYAF